MRPFNRECSERVISPLDLRKELKRFYAVKKRPEIIDVTLGTSFE